MQNNPFDKYFSENFFIGFVLAIPFIFMFAGFWIGLVITVILLFVVIFANAAIAAIRFGKALDSDNEKEN